MSFKYKFKESWHGEWLFFNTIREARKRALKEYYDTVSIYTINGKFKEHAPASGIWPA